MRKSVFAASILAAAVMAAPAGAATNPKTKAGGEPQTTTAKTRSQGWVAQCSSAARGAAPDCAVSQKIMLAQTGQTVAAITIRIPSDTRKPVMMLQGPLGVYLPPGMSVAFEKGKPVTIPMQTCDRNGCYAAQPLSADLLKKFRSEETLVLQFQNLNRQDVKVSVTLEGFAEAFDKVK